MYLDAIFISNYGQQLPEETGGSENMDQDPYTEPSCTLTGTNLTQQVTKTPEYGDTPNSKTTNAMVEIVSNGTVTDFAILRGSIQNLYF
jgi:hypothetical protein